jgi:adenosylcobinamide amidohydrolase
MPARKDALPLNIGTGSRGSIGRRGSAAGNRQWEVLLSDDAVTLRRSGRFLVADLEVPHCVVSTSVREGGQVNHVRHLLNHQSCEGTDHEARYRLMEAVGLDAYHQRVCTEAGLPSVETAVMGTAANMNYVAIVRHTDDDLCVTAAVTAGVEGNATVAGEPAGWRETGSGVRALPAYGGTINTILLINRPLTPAALVQVVVTMTEGKSAALQRLAVPSRRHTDLATGTGTDQHCIAAARTGAPPLTSASSHLKLGELIGVTTRDATIEALRWQNGLEASYTRGVFHALGRYGVREPTFLEDMRPFVEATDLELLTKNAKSALFEPLVGAAAHALAAVSDRVRYGTLPSAVASDALAQQAALLAANLAAQPQRWAEFRLALQPYAGGELKSLVLRALALGWSEKWRS